MYNNRYISFKIKTNSKNCLFIACELNRINPTGAGLYPKDVQQLPNKCHKTIKISDS